MNESRGLQRVVTLGAESMVGQTAKLRIDNRNQGLERILVAACPAHKKLAQLVAARILPRRHCPSWPQQYFCSARESIHFGFAASMAGMNLYLAPNLQKKFSSREPVHPDFPLM